MADITASTGNETENAKRGRKPGSSPIKASFATAMAIVAKFRQQWADDADGENVVGCLDKITAELQAEHDKDRSVNSGAWYSTGKGGEAFQAGSDVEAAQHGQESGAAAVYGPFQREVGAMFCTKHGNLGNRFPVVYSK